MSIFPVKDGYTFAPEKHDMRGKATNTDKGFISISPSMAPLLGAEKIGESKGPIDKRVLYLCWVSVLLALIMGFVAKGLVMLIGFFTNLFFYGTFSFAFSSPANNHLGPWVILIPVAGGLLVGLMARYGSVAIRGHGIPEAMEQVLENESRIPARITFLKPLSAAIAIGTGGPFGAEGPIIATGGALGSLIGQILRTTPEERKIVLTAGATAGMAAIFGSPVAAVLLAIELLLFEFSPRSIIPVALACATGAAMHIAFDGTDPIFSIPRLAAPSGSELLVYAFIGMVIGILGVAASKIIYAVEDLFEKLPMHWMWWPALGGCAVGIIGWFAPLTLGVGYDNILHTLEGNIPWKALLVLCILKFISWAIALGSGTSGGTLAPLLTIGSAAGALCAILLNSIFPAIHISVEMAALIGMASMFTGASRALLTSIVFAFETTLQPLVLLPLLVSCTIAYIISFLLMKNTIMTEKIVRRGISVPDKYSADYFERLTVSDAMQPPPRIQHPSSKPEHRIFEDTPLQEAITRFTLTRDEFISVYNRSVPETILGIVTPGSILKAYEQARKRNLTSGRTLHLRKIGYRLMIQARNHKRKPGGKKNDKGSFLK